MADALHELHSNYSARLASRQADERRLARLERLWGWVRLAAFAVAAALIWPALFAETLPAWSPALPVAAFVAAAWAQAGVVRRRTLAARAVRFYERGLARLEDRWVGVGRDGSAFQDADHPYAADLDLFGPGSLFQRLNAARTSVGESTLAAWLAAPAPIDIVLARQAAVHELADALDLRESLAVLADDVAADVDPRDLQRWAAAPPRLAARWPARVAPLLGALNLVATVLWLGTPVGALPLAVTAFVGAAFALAFRGDVRRVLDGIERPERELEVLASVLQRLEQAHFDSPHLRALQDALPAGGRSASGSIRRLARLAQVAESRRNMMFAPLSALLLVGTTLGFAIERWRAAAGPAVERWLQAIGELEALCSLGGYRAEAPGDPFPEIVAGGARFEGRDLGHPLLPAARCVRNDVVFDGELRLLLVSGSNMSGKSTLLRTVGINAALAFAGAPVRASRLLLSPLAVGAAMRVQDSLLAGMSHFYAEISRLRRLVEIGRGELPLLFLLDEILHGTNSHDRRVGAEAVIRGLLDDGGLGLVTTHDLALAQIADGLGARAANVHFEDRLEDGKIAFDYRLRAGIVQRSNALELMRAVGLDV